VDHAAAAAAILGAATGGGGGKPASRNPSPVSLPPAAAVRPVGEAEAPTPDIFFL
jgi:hypothetical protein